MDETGSESCSMAVFGGTCRQRVSCIKFEVDSIYPAKIELKCYCLEQNKENN
jgi:hypothetical protein